MPLLEEALSSGTQRRKVGTGLRVPVAYGHIPSTTDMIAMDAIW